MKIPILSFPWTCYNCGKEIKVTYPTTKDVYDSEFRGNLAPTYSKAMGEKVIGNLCSFCKAYQGNYFVWDDGLMGNAYELEKYLVGFFEKEIALQISEEEIEHISNENLFNRLQMYQEYLDSQEEEIKKE